MKVCIAEKPSVAAEIAKVLGAKSRMDGYFEGNGYQVTWTFGHLCELKSPDDYSDKWAKWHLSTLPMIPETFGIRLISNKGVKKQFGVIKKLFSKADEIINCGDAGQEGELIQRWVMQMAGMKCPVRRLWISSLTEEAIKDGFRHLEPQNKYNNLYKAGLARACGDWLMGMNLTRLYTLKYAPKNTVFSIGRVQTPTLAMIVSRDKEIQNFKPMPYWILTTKYRGTDFTAIERYNDKAKATNVLTSVKGHPLTITSIVSKETKEQPPQLYDLTSLQVELNNRYGYSASESLRIIQSLYEKKVSTYPRVDTRYLSDDIYQECPAILKSLTAYKDIVSTLSLTDLPKSKRVFDSSKVTDHHAIIPTGKTASLTDKEKKVYDLICRRFIAVFMPDCRYSVTDVTAEISGVKFAANGKRMTIAGWREAYNEAPALDKPHTDTMQSLPEFTKGESGPHTPMLREKSTSPPKHYTEATLLRAMETAGKFVEDGELREAMKDNGIGRPSSRASIIDTIIRRGYVKRDRKELISTPLGQKLISLIQFPLIKSPETTGRWEKRLREIERGDYDNIKFIKELESQLIEIINRNT